MSTPLNIMQDMAPSPTFKDYLDTLLKRKHLVITFFVVVVSITAVYNITRPDIYAASAQILIQEPVLWNAPDIRKASHSMDYLNTQIEVMKSVSVTSAVVEKANLAEKYPRIVGTDVKSAAKKIAEMIGTKQIGSSRIFYVTIKSTNPYFCAEVTNTLVDEYIEKDVMSSFLSSKDLLKKWFPEEEGKIKVEDIYGKLKELSADEMTQSFPLVVKDPKVIELKTKKENLERNLAADIKKYTDKHPKIINAKRELQIVKEDIRARANSIVNETKDTMSDKFQISNVKVIEYAEVPQAPVGPKRMKNFLLISIMALFAGCGLVLFIDYLDNTVKTQDDVERHIRLPYLGYVPFVKERAGDKKTADSKGYVVINPNEQKSAFLEALRNIRTSVIFSAAPDSLKSILITSALPKEGKSTIAFNLAVAISSDGSRTLLVDGDMRRPSLHKMAGIKNAAGLSNYLTSKIALDEVLQDTQFQNLKLMTCGPIPPNPSELFSSYRMKELLDEAKARFDRIIFDGAPIFGISDSVILAKTLNGVIQVIRFGKVTWDIANKSKQRLQDLGVKITGIIINGVDIQKESYYYKYYDYRYHKYYE